MTEQDFEHVDKCKKLLYALSPAHLHSSLNKSHDGITLDNSIFGYETGKHCLGQSEKLVYLTKFEPAHS